MKNLFIFCCFILPQFLLAQVAPSLKMVSKAIETYSDYEKTYLHTDREYYTGGGDIFFKVYLTDETLSPQNAKSKVAYVDLIGPNQAIIDTKTIAIKGGKGIGDFKITSKYKSGNYLLRAYTQYMKNFDTDFFFRKTIYIRGVTNLAKTLPAAKTTFDVQFFPEGGDLVQGLSSKVAVKASNHFGKGITLKGRIITEEGELIQEVTTNKNGFGQFMLPTKADQTYLFEGQYKGQPINKKLPMALSEGAVLSIHNQASETIQVQIESTPPTSLAGGMLIGQAMGKVFFKQEIIKQATTNIAIDVTAIPFGVLQFTLFDKLGQPRAERLVFNQDGIDNFNVDITTNQNTYSKREKVQLKLDIYDDEGETLPADLSLSVVDNSVETANFNKDNIQSYLLLSSDIKGIIEHPTSYFKDIEPATKAALDLLLMTQGWRRFIWQDVLKKPAKEMIFPPEQSLSLTGKITKKDKTNEPIKAVGYLSELSASLSLMPFETDETGQFSIDNLYATKGTDMVLQAAAYDKKQQKVKKGNLTLKGNRSLNIIVADKPLMPISKKGINFHHLANNKKQTVTTLTNLEKVQYKNDLAYNGVDDLSIELDSISVTAKKIDEVIEYYEDGMLYKRPDTRIKMDEVVAPNSHNDLLGVIKGRTPGITVDEASKTVTMRGMQTGLSKNVTLSNNARFMVNGALVSNEYAFSINPDNIAFIDILRGFSQLAMYGEVGANGLVMIYLKTPQDQENKPKEVEGIKNITFDGFDEARVFYAPTYDITNRENSKVDNRVTLYWTPTISIDDSGEAYLEFYTSDRTGVFDIILEGISQAGLPIVAQSKIIVK